MKILIIQPYLAKYRVDLFNQLKKKDNEIVVLYSKDKKYSYGANIKKKFFTKILKKIDFKFFYLQIGMETFLLKYKPDKVFISANFRCLNFWLLITICKLLSIPVFLHGHGMFKKSKINFIYRLIFNYSLLMCTKYICYNKFVKKKLLLFNFDKKKLTFLNNTLINKHCLKPSFNRKKDELIFIGRLRNSTNLELLFYALQSLKNDHNIIYKLKIIGDGENKLKLVNLAKFLKINVKFLGNIYDDIKIRNICKNSCYGIYPGNAGLSVVHYMSLSLIPIMHDDIIFHSGPEVSYVKKKFNGFTFIRNNKRSLVKILKKICFLKQEKIFSISRNAHETYLKLNYPNFSTKLLKILV